MIDNVREKVEGSPIVKMMVEACLRWFEHVWRRPVEARVKKVDRVRVIPNC